MSSDNTVDDRLLEARKKTARQENPATGKVALIGAIALLVSPVSILGWIVGTAAVVTGAMAVKHPAAAKTGQDRHRARRGRDPDRRLLLHPDGRAAVRADDRDPGDPVPRLRRRNISMR